MAVSRSISIKLPLNIFDEINSIASERKRKRTDILKEALELYLDDWNEYKVAVQRLNDPFDEILNEKEFLGELREDFGWTV